MAIVQFAGFSISVKFDGVSDTFVWDAYEAIAALPNLNNRVPTAVTADVGGSPPEPTAVAVLQGTIVGITFTPAPPAGLGTIGVGLEF